MEYKKEIFHAHARLPKDDGTYLDYYDYYMKHPQKDPEILRVAVIEFSEYVVFCMNIVVCYKSKKTGKYRQVAFEDDELDYEDFQIQFSGNSMIITKDTDLDKVDYPNLKGLMDMEKLNEEYTQIFRRLLRGESFLNG